MADEEQQQMQEPMEGDEEAVPVVIDRSKLTPNMRHYLAMSKLHSQNEYSKGTVLNMQQEKNEFTKTFCDQAEYQINKKVHDETVDRNYQKGKNEAVDTMKGHQNLGYDNPKMAHHAKNNELLSDTYYKEDYEQTKDIVYFPVDAAPTYQTTKRVKMATDDKNYKADYEEMKKQNQLNLCETPVYKTQQEVKSKTQDANYKKDYEQGKIQVHPAPVTHEMVQSKKQQAVLTKDAYTKEGLGAIRSYNNDAGMLNRGDIQQAMKTQKIDDHLKLEYKKEYEENKVKLNNYDKALVDVPLIKQNILASKQADPTNTKYGESGRKAMERNEFTKTYCDTNVYKTNKKITEITRDSLYQKQRQEAIDQFKGFQQLDINQVGSFKQHMANQENQSDNYYKEEYNLDKDLVYFPANVTDQYEQQKKLNKVKLEYKDAAAKDAERHQFNLADSQTYKTANDVKMATNDREYTKKWQQQKIDVKPAAVTPQMELIKKNAVTKDSAYTEQWNKDKLQIHYPPDNPAMLNAKKAAKQSSDLHYKKDYNENVLGAKSHMTADGDLEYVVAKNVQDITGANYSKDAREKMGEHGFAPEFVQTEAYKINKNITEITSDRYKRGAKENAMKCKGYQNMDPAHNPSIQHHAKNADQLNPYLYKEDYEYEKHDFYFPQHATEGYVNQKKLQEKVGQKEYVEDYEKMKKKNVLNLAETEKYQIDHEVEKFRSDIHYKEKYANEVQGHCIGFTTTPHMETIKQVKPYQNDSSYKKAAMEAMKKNVMDETNPELELSRKRQEIRSDVHYKKDYRDNVQGHNIPGPIDNYHDYKTQHDLKAVVNNKAYTEKWEEDKLKMSITKEYCNTEQYKAQQKVKECQSNANYTDFPETRDKYKGFQQLDITTIPSFMMHSRNADQLSEACYKEDWNIDKECVYYPVQVTEKYSEDKKLKKAMNEYTKDYNETKAEVNFNACETEKYLQDKETLAKTSNAGYTADYKQNVQGTMKGTPVTMEMENLKKLEITKVGNYGTDAKNRMKTYERSLQDPDYQTQLKAQVQRSDKDYKKDYNENVLGHYKGATVEGHLDYKAQMDVRAKTQDAAYKKEANEQMRTYTLEPDAPVLRNNIEVQKTVNQALYTKSGKEAIEQFKGFQQLDVYKNPFLNRHIINSENLSDAMYREGYEIDKDCIYYPYNTSEKYAADKNLHDVAGDLAYSAKHKEEDWKHGFDLCTSEKYLEDKKGAKFTGKAYKAKYLADAEAGKGGGKLVHTWEIDAKNVMQPLRDRLYKASANQLQRKYHLMMDDLKLEHLMKVQNVQNDRIYKSKYEAETKGKGAADPGIAYPQYKEQIAHTEKMRQSKYQEGAREAMKTVHYDTWEEQHRARAMALSVKDSEYRKSRDKAVATMKGFQTMDAAYHPDVVRGNRAADLASHWIYINDWEEEKDLVFYPVHESEKYIADKKNHDVNTSYSNESKQIASKVRFNLADTEKYAADKKHENTRSDKHYQADYKANSHIYKGTDETMQMVVNKSLVGYSGINYAKEAKALSMKYGLTADDSKLAASMLSGKITSDLLYKKHWEENVKGKSAVNPGIAYEMSTEMAKRNNKQLSDAHYQKEGRAAMEHNEYTKQQYSEMVKARLVALKCNDAEYKKGKNEAVEEFKGYMKMDAASHPIVTRGIQVSELLSDALYKEDWEIEKDLIYYPVNVTPMYETMKNNKLFQSDLNYKANYEETKFQNKFNSADTEKYASDHKVKQFQSDKYYKQKWDTEERHQFKTPAVTMEMERVTPLKKLTAGVYAREAKNLAMKYGLVYDDLTLTNLIAVGSLASDIHYQKQYRKEDLGKSSKADFHGFLPYVSQKDVKDKTCDKNYKAAAIKVMEHNNYQEFNEAKKSQAIARSCNESEYKKSYREAIDAMKGYMRMDAHLHPVVQRGVLVAEMQSQALYTEEWNIEKDAIYFPVQLTPGYDTAMNAHKIQSDLNYHQDYEATKHVNKFNAATTEKYEQDKKLSANVRSDKGYHAEHEKSKVVYTLIDKTSEMERASIQRDLRDANYQREAKKLAMKYGLTHDDLKLKTLMAVGGLASDKIYKKAYNKEMLGLKSTADVRGYLPYVTGKEVHDKTMDKNYQKAAKEANMHNKFVQWEEELRARKMALSVKDSAYKKSMWDAIEEYKGFMRMDAALHPVVQRGIHQAELVSDALYKEEWNIEKDLIYFPVQVTPGYETATQSQIMQSDRHYHQQHEETKMNNKFDPSQTERYKDIQVHNKSRSDKHYKSAYEETKHVYKGTAVTMDMERARIQLDINESNYKKEAKKLSMKYGLTPDDTKLANCIAVARATSDRLYKKHWVENVQGASNKADVSGHPVYKDASELKKKLGKNYTKDAMKNLEKNNYAQFDEEVRARTVALYCNPDEYSKQQRECINEFKGYMRMDAALHPVVQRGILVAELQSEALYREDYELEKDLIYFPAQVTPGYEAAQHAYKFASDLQYRKAYNDGLSEERPNKFNQCQTEKYISDKQTEKARSDYHYKKDYNDMKAEGKAGGKGVAVTMEMERIKANEKIAVNLYNKEAKQLAMKYGLDAKDMTMQNLIGVQQIRSDLNYKKKYNQEMLGLKSTADLKGYPHLESSHKLQKEMTVAEYQKGAREMLKKNNYVKFNEQERAETMAYSVRGSNYNKQGRECIEKFKGFQRMDAHQHPIIIEGERVNNIISHSKYIEDYLIDRNVIYYPVHLTPGYESAMFADKWQSNISYHKDYKETRMKNKFNMADTDRYDEIKKNEQYRSDTSYKAKQMKEFAEGKGMSSIPETSEMVISKFLKPLRADYQKEAKQLATKYGLVHGAMEIAHAMEMSELTNANLYKKDWEKNVQGTSAKNPAIAHPLHDLYKACQTNLNDKNYKKDLDSMHTYTVADSDEAVRARKTALMCTPKEYNKQRAETVEKYKGFQRMDAASHPIVIEGERVNNLISKAKYLEDYLIDRESVFYPVHMTEGYEVAINSSKFQSQKNYKASYEETKGKNVYNTVDTDKYKEDLKTNQFRSDNSYAKKVKDMFSRGEGHTEITDRFDVNLSKSLKDTRGENYTRQAKEICGKYGLAHDAMAITAAIAIGDQISTRLYKKKYETEVKGLGAKNPGIAHPEYIHYKDVQASLNETNYKAEYEKTQHTYTAVESDEILRARKVALVCTDKEYKKQRQEVIDKFKGFQHMDAHLHPVVAEGERVNDIISHSKYIEDYLLERNYIYFPAHITPGYETAVAVNKFASDIPYRQDYLATRHKNTFNSCETEKYQQGKDFVQKYSDKNYSSKWHASEKLKFTSVPDTPVLQQAAQNTKMVKSNSYAEDAKKILAKYGLEFQNMGLQHAIESAKHAKDYLYKDKYNKETLGKGAVYKGIDDVCDYSRAKANQANLNHDNYTKTGKEFNHTFTPVYDTPIQLTALQNQKNIDATLYAKSRIEAVEKFKGFQRMDAASHPIVIEGERVNNIISHQKYIEDYLIDRNVIYYPVHLTPGYEAQMFANKWQSNLHYDEDYNKTKIRHQFNMTQSEKYIEDKERHAKISNNQYGREWKQKLHTAKQHTEIVDPTEVKLSKAVKPWIGKTAYTKAAQEVAARHGLVAGDLSLQHAAESQMQLSMKDYRKVWCESVQGKGGNYKSVDDMFIEKQAKQTQAQLSQRVYKAKDEELNHKYTPVVDTPDMRRVKAQAGLLNEVAYSQSRRDCVDKFKGFQNMDAHSHPIVVRGTEASERISNAKYTEEWNEMKEMIYFPVQITPGYESAMTAYQNQSQLLYNKDYHRTKHANQYNHCITENYEGIQKADKARADYYYQQNYRENRGKGFTSVKTLKEETMSDVQKKLSMKDYHTDAKAILGKYNIDSNAMQITHAAEVYKQASQKVYLKNYDENVKGAPSKYFHQTETYDVYKKNADLNNPNKYTEDYHKTGHKFTADNKSVAMEHAKSVINFCSQHDYTTTQREVNKAFKAYSKLVMQDDMNAMRSLENSKNVSHWKYIEDYLEEREFSFYPVHITPGYELAIKHMDFVSDKKYRKEYHDNKKKANVFRVNDTEFYKFNKDLQNVMSVHKYHEQYNKDKSKGYTGVKGGKLDMVQETLHDAQMRLSNWKYRAAAETAMSKFNLDIEVPTFQLAKANQLQQSESKYRSDGKLTNTKYTSAGKDEFALEMHNKNKKNMNPNLYKEEYEKTQHTYTFKPDQISVKLARDVAKMQSDREYRKKYADDVKTASAFKNIDMWPEDRFHSEVSKLQSAHVYMEDYLIDRECCFYPVHITPGYELALEVNRFQSDWLYKQKYNKENKGKPNAFKQSETEYYTQSKNLNNFQNEQKYRTAGKKQNEKWQFTIITPVNEHVKQMKELNHPTKYTNEAKKIQMKYDLPLQRVDLEAHREAKKIVSNYMYHQKYRDDKGKSHLWNADTALEGDRHKDNAKNMSNQLYKEAAAKTAPKINLPVDMLSLTVAKDAAAACSNLDYKKTYEEAIKQCRAFTKLASTDIKEYEHHNYVQRILSDKHYKEEWYDQQGWCIPEFDTPELRRLKEQYDRGDVSDVIYKKMYNKKVKGKGLTVFDGPEFQHAKDMKKEQSKIAYEADGKDKHKWASWMANQTPGAVEMKEAQKFQSDNNYIDRSEYQGRGAACITDEIDARLEAQKMQSTNEYKKDYEENKHVSKFVTVTDAIDAVGFKEAQKMQSENAYKKQHLEEDIGKPTELAMSIKLNEDRVHQQLASELPYKSKGEKAKHIQSYQNNLFLTPWAKYVEEMKNLVSDIKYKQEWEDEKSCIWLPYWWTVEYEHFKAQTEEKNMQKYTEKANKMMPRTNLQTTEAPSIAYVKEVGQLASNVNYGDIKDCVQKFPTPKFVVDSPAMVSQREAQDLVSDNKYKMLADAEKHNHAMDPTGFSFMTDQYRKEAMEASKDTNVAKLDKSYSVPMTSTTLKDDLKTKEYVESQKLASENKYRMEAKAEMHAVNGCDVVDTPLNETHTAAQEHASDLKYKHDISKMKILYDGMEDVKAAQHKQDILSDLKYHEEYESFWKGAVLSLPVPFDMNMESMCDRQKVRDDKEYRKDAKEQQQQYIVVADTPRMRELKAMCELASDRVYKTEAVAEMQRVNMNVIDSFTNMEVKRIEALKDNRAYKAEAMAEMSLNAQIPTKEIEHQLFSTKVADKVEYRKEGKQLMTQNLQPIDGKDQQHAKLAKDLTNERAYKADATTEMHMVNCNVVSADMKNKQEVQKLTDETSYKKDALAEMQQVNMNITDSYAMNNAKQIMENVSDVHYKSSDQFGGVADNEWCFQIPADKHVRSAVDINKVQSDAEYKKAFNAEKGKVAFIPADTPEFTRLKKMQEQYSDLEYREAAKKGMKDITFTPSMKEATKASEFASDVKYRKDGREYVKKNTQAKDAVTQHQTKISEDTLLSARKYKEQFLEEAGQSTALQLKDDLLMTTLDKSQKQASKTAYKQKAGASDFTKLDKTYDQDRHQDNLQVVSDARYKQKLDGKSLDMVPEIESKLEFQNLASSLPYVRDANQHENKFEAQTTQMYKQLHDLKKVQSEVTYKKKARQEMDKHKAEGLENRTDIDHTTNVTKLCSENEYKKNKQQSGFTFVPEAPLHDHHRHAGHINSELMYKRAGLESQKGKGVQLDEHNPFQQNFSDAQRFTSGRNYKTAAKDLMARGAACVEDDPNMERVRKAGRILSDREYRKDFEKGVKGYGYDLRSTPQMAALKNAEKIKSDKNYKKQYEESMKGKGAFTMESPQMKAAMAAQALMRGEKLGGIGDVPDAIAANDKWVAARVTAILDTPEMRRIKEAKKNSQSNYRDVDYSKGAKVVLDTPEMQRIKNASKIQSKVGYSDNKVRGRSCGVLDTPEMRMVKRNQKNFSNLDYKKDLNDYKGRAIQVVDDLNTRRAKKATEIASDLSYKGIRGKVDEMEQARNMLENQAKQERIRSQAPAQAKGFKVGRGMQRYNADPGSIFELDDPTDIEQGTHGKSLRGQRPSSRLSEIDQQDDSDYELLANWDPKKLEEHTSGNWQNYLTGSYRKAYTPGHVMKYKEADSHQALEHVGYESSFYGSNMATPAPQYQHEEEEEEVISITFKALYDYQAADDDEISFCEGDIIVQAQPVGGGWYFGVVERSGASGMLPGNYVEQLN